MNRNLRNPPPNRHSYVNVVTGTSQSLANHDNNATDTASDVNGISHNTHPLYLHNNDQRAMILISKKLIGSENYASWKRSI